jgi:4-diphosphocytidyl-2-C-methyl-D-erythritol kinase
MAKSKRMWPPAIGFVGVKFLLHKLDIDAKAKINLTLDVLYKRPDGYHEVEMIMQTLALKDNITLELRPKGQIELLCDCDLLPHDEKNLAWQAAKLMLDEFAPDTGIKIELRKNIPIAAGLAGGSADAAAVMLGINELLGLKRSKEELMNLGKRLGADIPFCIMGGTALVRGIGEKLTVLKPAPKMDILLFKPHFFVSTREVYSRLNVKDIKKRPDITTMIKTIEHQDVKGLAEGLCNVLEEVTFNLFPCLREIKLQFKKCKAMGSLMAGSGPTIFAIYDSKKEAQIAAANMAYDGHFFVTEVE